MAKGHSSPQPIYEHLQELRKRLLYYLLILLFTTIIGYLLSDYAIKILIYPLHQKLFYTSPAGGFNFTIQFSLFLGFIFSLPFLIYQIIHFVKPAFPKLTINVFKLIVVAFLLAILGMSFAYVLILPSALYFLQNFADGEYMQSLITTNEYFPFIMCYLGGFALFFQLPFIFYIINSAVKLKWQTILSFQKYIIALSFLAAAIITPTGDVINLLFMAIPILILFYISVIEIAYLNKNKQFRVNSS